MENGNKKNIKKKGKKEIKLDDFMTFSLKKIYIPELRNNQINKNEVK